MRRAALVAAALAAGLVAAATPAVADWVGDAVRSVVGDDGPPKRAKSIDRLPGGGRVLVSAMSRDGTSSAWIAGEGVQRRLAREADRATWSPTGRFAALARDSELVAVDLRGRRRWTIAAPAPVDDVVWSPDGFRVAYTAGTELRLVAGDGTGDRRVAIRRVRLFDGLAWRPGSRHVLAFADGRTLFVADTDRRRVLWRTAVEGGSSVDFSPDGRRLLVADGRGVRVLDADDGRTLQRRRRSRGILMFDAMWDRTGRTFALVRHAAASADVVVGRPRGRTIRLRRLFAARQLDLGGFSPDNRWLLVEWMDNDSWLFLPLTGGRPRQVTGVRRRFGGVAAGVQTWCCAPTP